MVVYESNKESIKENTICTGETIEDVGLTVDHHAEEMIN